MAVQLTLTSLANDLKVHEQQCCHQDMLTCCHEGKGMCSSQEGEEAYGRLVRIAEFVKRRRIHVGLAVTPQTLTVTAAVQNKDHCRNCDEVS